MIDSFIVYTFIVQFVGGSEAERNLKRDERERQILLTERIIVKLWVFLFFVLNKKEFCV